ncbi:MAG: hypothetical protein HND58_08130 [Planctomycetota bacterium]|nr:MAG: hypothetical protein HND58_08130 [Planctomycetota bacterium]
MEQIERELLDGDRSPADALAEGSQQLESIADRVEREAAAEALADQATREAMADSIDAGEDDSAAGEGAGRRRPRSGARRGRGAV